MVFAWHCSVQVGRMLSSCDLSLDEMTTVGFVITTASASDLPLSCCLELDVINSVVSGIV